MVSYLHRIPTLLPIACTEFHHSLSVVVVVVVCIWLEKSVEDPASLLPCGIQCYILLVEYYKEYKKCCCSDS